MVLPIIGPLFSTIGSAAGGAAGLAGSAASGLGSLAGSAIQGAGSLAGNIANFAVPAAHDIGVTATNLGEGVLWEAGNVAGDLAAGFGGALEGAGELLGGLPEIGKAAKPIANTLGQVYGAYSSYEQAKAAREAAQRYGRQVRLPVGSIPTGVSAPVHTPIPTINVSGGGGPPMTEEERLYRQAQQTGQLGESQLLKYAIIGLGIYLIATKV